MESNTLKNYFSQKKLSLTVVAVFLFLVVLANSICFIVSKNYNKIYGNKVVMEDGTADFLNGEGMHSWVDAKLDGEWEFYYNQWLITDNISQREPTALLTPTDRWTTVVVNDKHLSKTGYASYRIILRNLPPDAFIVMKTYDAPVSWRAYVDGVMVTQYGNTMSKVPGECVISASIYHDTSVATEKGKEYELIVEVSASEWGGIGAPTTVSFRLSNKVAMYANFLMSGIAVGLMLFGICFCFVLLYTQKNIGYICCSPDLLQCFLFLFFFLWIQNKFCVIFCLLLIMAILFFVSISLHTFR